MKVDIRIRKERCKGCGICVAVCQAAVLEFATELNSEGYPLPAVVSFEKCINCGLCEMLCPDFAIQITATEEESLL